MDDYGLARLKQLSEQRNSSGSVSELTRINEIIDILSNLAASLREESVRKDLQGSAIPEILVNLLNEEAGNDRSRVVLEVGRVAANYGAENSSNLDALLERQYPQSVVEVLSAGNNSLSFAARRALVASILNAIRSDHEATKEALSQPDVLRFLLSLPSYYSPFDDNADEEEDEARASVAEWLWTIIEGVTIQSPSNFSIATDKTTMIGLLDPIKAFTPPRQVVREAWWDSLLLILQQYCQCLEQLASLESTPNGPPLRHVAAYSDETVTNTILDFAEYGDLPPDHDFGSDEEEGEEGIAGTAAKIDVSDPAVLSPAQKALGKAKSNVVSFLTSLCWEVPYDPASPIWRRMRSWLAKATDDREDLTNTALMCFANGVRSAEIGVKLLNGENSLLPIIMPLLSSSTRVTMQHAVIGLLKNLAHPPENKVILGEAGVVGRLLDMEVFSDKRDVVGTVQGGSAGLIKLLCMDNVKNSSDFLRHPDALDQVLALIKRTDDPNIGYEATRIFINVIKSLSSSKNGNAQDLTPLSQRSVIVCLVDLLRRTWKWPILINDSIISLTLLTISGTEETATVILEELEKEHEAKEEEEQSGAEVLQRIISSSELDQGIKSNTETLMLQLKERAGKSIDVIAA